MKKTGPKEVGTGAAVGETDRKAKPKIINIAVLYKMCYVALGTLRRN